MIAKRHQAEQHVALKVKGSIAATANQDWDFAEGDYEIKNIWAEVGTAGVTGTMVVDVNLNGTTIFAAGTKITFAEATAPSAYSALATKRVSKGDKLSIDVDSINSGTAAKDLTVHIQLAPAYGADPTNVSPANLVSP